MNILVKIRDSDVVQTHMTRSGVTIKKEYQTKREDELQMRRRAQYDWERSGTRSTTHQQQRQTEHTHRLDRVQKRTDTQTTWVQWQQPLFLRLGRTVHGLGLWSCRFLQKR